MDFISTRDASLTARAPRAVLNGIAPDGGLYVTPAGQQFSFDVKTCLSFPPLQMAEMILNTVLPGFEQMDTLVKNAYAGKFETDDLTPVKQVGNDFVLELFRGPTSAFKDVALSMLPQLIRQAKKQENAAEETVILTATSGDTGKAALEGFHDVPGTRIFVFYPDGGVSTVQKMQMATQEGANVRVCAVRGNFDDCQRGVKQAFLEIESKKLLDPAKKRLSSANSINIGRLAPQIVYYFIAYQHLLKNGQIKMGDLVDFSVPTGNFGDILAGYYAKLLGLPVGTLLCASNQNNVLTDFLLSGEYQKNRPFYKTTSPSMDILVSSNLERLLYLKSGDAQYVQTLMASLNETGIYQISPELLKEIQKDFAAGWTDETEVQKTISSVWTDFGYLMDPHTAVAWHAAQEYKKQHPGRKTVILSTASPYKFPTAVLGAISDNIPANEFDQMDALQTLTGVPIPNNLKSLRAKPILHTDVIDAEQMIPYILTNLSEE